jgi:hypothetical protein
MANMLPPFWRVTGDTGTFGVLRKPGDHFQHIKLAPLLSRELEVPDFAL